MIELNTHTHWSDAVQALEHSGSDYVLVTLLGSRGSTPRGSGTKMVFCAQAAFGTIGGGHLELRVAAIAGEMLGRAGQHIEHFPLGPSLGQCCGGSTGVLFESFVGNGLSIALFGAGHVGSTLAPLLQQMPCRLSWIDSRENYLEAGAGLAGNVSCITSERPEEEVAALPPGTWYLIMTHNHQQDYAILKAALARRDAGYIGLIGSATKWRRFRMRLEHEGLEQDDYAAVHCPVGLPQVPGKRPVEVAVSVAAQVIGLYQQQFAGESAPGPTPAEQRRLSDQLSMVEAENE